MIETRSRTDVRSEIRALTLRHQELTRELGTAVVAGKDVSTLRAERREIREKLEDLHSADLILVARGES